jgi:hypothetical protein
MTRQELKQAVLRGLPPDADAVVSPDHPLLLHGPDVIAAIHGTLIAYFISLRGAREIAAILPKVMLSRLAFPPGAACVLVLGEPITPSNDLSVFFEEIVVLADGEQPIIPIGTTATSAGLEAAESMRTLHHERFADTWTATTRRHGVRRRRLPGEPTSLYGVRAPRLPTRYMDFHHGEFFFVPSPAAGPSRIRTWLSKAIDIAVSSDYGLEAGIDGLSTVSRIAVSGDAHLARHYSVMPSLPATRAFDSLKPLRAAAFAGYATKLGQANVI